MAEAFPAEFMQTAGSHTELLGTPGAYTVYAVPSDLGARAVDVSCPGCGENTFQLHPEKYHVSGPDQMLTCRETIDFHCCGPYALKMGHWQAADG